MIFKIMRGALVGIILGVLFAVSISGAIYMKEDTEDKLRQQKDNNVVSINTKELQENTVEEGEYIMDDQTAYKLGQSILEPRGVAVNTFHEEEISNDQIEEETDYSYLSDVEINPSEETYNNVQNILLRFHVKANSDSEEDIELKYKVRDAVLEEFDSTLQEFTSKEEAIEFLEDNLEDIQTIADRVIEENGYDYATTVYLTDDYFPMRQYGELVIPAGYYQALRIDIGEAMGENFWCVLYPMMCYPVDGGAVITEEDGKKLKRELSEEEFEKLFVDKEVKKDEIEIRFKFLEWLGL